MRPGLHRQPQHVEIRVGDAARQGHQSCSRDRDHEHVDRQQIGRKQPAGTRHLALGIVFDDDDVELARQQDHATHAQQGDRQPFATVEAGRKSHDHIMVVLCARPEHGRSVEHGKNDEQANRRQGCQLDDALGGDGQHQAVLVLGCVDVPGAEQHREGCQRQRDDECGIEEDEARKIDGGKRAASQQRLDRDRNGFELQRNIRQAAHDHDEGGDGSNGLALAIAGGNEIRDRRQVLAF